MQKTDKWSEQISFYRFWKNEKVSESALSRCAINHCIRESHSVPHILLLEDTTEMNLESHRQRIKDHNGLGVVGNNKDLGFFFHPTLAVNACDNSLLGVADIHLWHRQENALKKDVRNLPIEKKESYRWPERAIAAKNNFPSDVQLTVVQDREGDIYESFCQLHSSGLDFVIRASYDRKLSSSTHKLKEHISELSPVYNYELEVKGNNKQRKKRNALMEVRFEKVSLLAPEHLVNLEDYPPSLSLYVLQVKEKQESVPRTEKPIEWTLYTTHQVCDEKQALQIVQYYASRWIIEDLFRTIKTEGVNYESSELESGTALRKLFMMALIAAIQLLQLRQSRQGNTSQQTSLVFSDEQVACMEDLLPRLEGKTEKQKNPFTQTNLAWATWIIARLGGWKGYASQRPPGVITLHQGWTRFNNIFEGWDMAKNVYKR